MPTSIKAENAVIRYLNSINKHDNVELLMTSELFYPDTSLAEGNRILLSYISGPNYKSDIDTVNYPHIKDTAMNHLKGYELICQYRVNKLKHTGLFKIDTAFKRVEYIIEINSEQ